MSSPQVTQTVSRPERYIKGSGPLPLAFMTSPPTTITPHFSNLHTFLSTLVRSPYYHHPFCTTPSSASISPPSTSHYCFTSRVSLACLGSLSFCHPPMAFLHRRAVPPSSQPLALPSILPCHRSCLSHCSPWFELFLLAVITRYLIPWSSPSCQCGILPHRPHCLAFVLLSSSQLPLTKDPGVLSFCIAKYTFFQPSSTYTFR